MEADTQAQPSGDTALHCALSRAAYRTAAADNTRCVKMLINKGANCNRLLDLHASFELIISLKYSIIIILLHYFVYQAE